jgi:uncharacterized sulfatase
VEFIDIYPTIVAAGGKEIPSHCAGRSLVPLLNDPLAEWENAEAITQILRPSDSRLPQPVMGCSIRTPRWRFTEWAEGKEGIELYDYHSDPGEFRNLAINPDESTRALIDNLRTRLRKKASGKIPETPFNEPRL